MTCQRACRVHFTPVNPLRALFGASLFGDLALICVCGWEYLPRVKEEIMVMLGDVSCVQGVTDGVENYACRVRWPKISGFGGEVKFPWYSK